MKKIMFAIFLVAGSGTAMAQSEKSKGVQAETTASMEAVPVAPTADEIRKKEKEAYLEGIKAEEMPRAQKQMEQRQYLDEKRKSIQEEKSLSTEEKNTRLKELDEIQAGKKQSATPVEKNSKQASGRKKAPQTVAP